MSSSTDRITVGRIGKPFGLEGFVTVRVDSDDPDRFRPGAMFPGPDGSILEVEESRDAVRGILLRFRDHRSRDAAERLRGIELTISETERRALGTDEYWPDQLVGLTTIDSSGAELGRVVAFVDGSAQDRLVVEMQSGSTVEVPFVAELVPTVDIEEGRIFINDIPGLLSEQ